MAYSTPSAIAVIAWGVPSPASCRYPRNAWHRTVVGFATGAAGGLLAAWIALAAAWMLSASLGANFASRARPPMAFDVAAIAEPRADMVVVADRSGSHRIAVDPGSPLESADALQLSEQASAPDLAANVAAVIAMPFLSAGRFEPATSEPVPQSAEQSAAAAPAPDRPAPSAATIAPPPAPPQKRGRSAEEKTAAIPLPDPDRRTAVYDIAAHAVYLPNGERLEAHSGLGARRDDPRYVSARNRGPTPPNTYNLVLREQLFHGVRAIRLVPVDESKMYGRDGILAHSYMLGSNGQSNGCVSFRNYPAFLHAFLKGQVDRMVVVSRLANGPARATRVRADGTDRYAFDNRGPASRPNL